MRVVEDRLDSELNNRQGAQGEDGPTWKMDSRSFGVPHLCGLIRAIPPEGGTPNEEHEGEDGKITPGFSS